MKNVLKMIVATTILWGSVAYGQVIFPEDRVEVVSTIFERSQSTKLVIEEETFIPNILGYACPVPAINLKKYHVWSMALSHGRFGNFGVKEFALRVKNPNMRFCNWPVATGVFGPDFIVGAEMSLDILVKRDIIKVDNHDGTFTKYLREDISSELNGILLHSRALVELEPRP